MSVQVPIWTLGVRGKLDQPAGAIGRFSIPWVTGPPQIFDLSTQQQTSSAISHASMMQFTDLFTSGNISDIEFIVIMSSGQRIRFSLTHAFCGNIPVICQNPILFSVQCINNSGGVGQTFISFTNANPRKGAFFAI